MTAPADPRVELRGLLVLFALTFVAAALHASAVEQAIATSGMKPKLLAAAYATLYLGQNVGRVVGWGLAAALCATRGVKAGAATGFALLVIGATLAELAIPAGAVAAAAGGAAAELSLCVLLVQAMLPVEGAGTARALALVALLRGLTGFVEAILETVVPASLGWLAVGLGLLAAYLLFMRLDEPAPPREASTVSGAGLLSYVLPLAVLTGLLHALTAGGAPSVTVGAADSTAKLALYVAPTVAALVLWGREAEAEPRPATWLGLTGVAVGGAALSRLLGAWGAFVQAAAVGVAVAAGAAVLAYGARRMGTRTRAAPFVLVWGLSVVAAVFAR